MITRLKLIQEWQSANVKIPKGWRQVREDEPIKAGDKYHIYTNKDEWILVKKDDRRVGMNCYSDCFSLHITRKRKSRKIKS